MLQDLNRVTVVAVGGQRTHPCHNLTSVVPHVILQGTEWVCVCEGCMIEYDIEGYRRRQDGDVKLPLPHEFRHEWVRVSSRTFLHESFVRSVPLSTHLGQV